MPGPHPQRVVLRQSGQFHLRADERRPLRPADVFEGVGVDQPRGVVVRVVEDRPEQGVEVGHP